MKVAICLSGQTRDIYNTLVNIKNAWYNYETLDFFVHSWINNEYKPFRVDTPMDIAKNDINHIIETLKPKSLLLEYPKIFEKVYNNSPNWNCYHPTKNPNPSQNIQSMFYSLNKSNQLKKQYEVENNFKYDCVIRCRFDYFFTKKYDLRIFDLGSLNCKDDCKHTDYAINDHLALSNSHTMDIYSDMFFHIDKYYDMGIQFNPEVMLGFHVKYNSIKVSKTLGSYESYVSTKEERKNNI